MKLSWTALCSYRLVTKSLISLLRRIRREGLRTRRILVLVDSLVVLGAVSKRRSSSRKVNFMFRKLGFWCLAFVITLELVCRPGRTQLMPRLGARRSGVSMRRYRGFLRFLVPPFRRLRYARSWTCSVSRCRPRSLQQPTIWCFQQFGTSTCLRRERPSTSLREYVLDFKRDASTSCKCQKQLEGRETLLIRHVGLTTSPSSLFRVGASKNTLGQKRAFLCVHKTSWCRTSCQPPQHGMTWPFENLKTTCESGTFVGLRNLSAIVSTNWVVSVSDTLVRVLRQETSD